MALESTFTPEIKTKLDRDILIVIGAAQEEDRYYNMKQLSLLGVGAEATLRRRIAFLIKCGYLDKKVMPNDGRVTVYAISKTLWKRMAQLESKLIDASCANKDCQDRP